MTMDQDYKQPESDSGKAEGAAADDNTREGTKEDIRSLEDDKAASKVEAPDNLRDGSTN